MLNYRKKDGRTIGLLMGDAVKSSVNMILIIGGFVILFSVITCILKLCGILTAISKLICTILPLFDHHTVSSLLVGVLEVTNGIKECAALSLPLITKASMVSFLIGFGGLSVNAQVLSIISETDLNFGIYIILKVVQGLAASFYTYISFGMFNSLQVINVYKVFKNYNFIPYSSYNWSTTFINSTINMVMIFSLILIAGIIFSWNPSIQNKR
jgi:nucleoside recognition membrane protein YjiH